MKKNIVIALTVLLASCTPRERQRLQRNNQVNEREYSISQFSGGHVVFTDHFKGIINQEEHSDGIYYFKGDTLIELSSPYLIKSDR